MAKYRKISPSIWNDEKVRGMTDRGKLALLFLLTHPHMTALGAIRANVPGLACELGWTTEAFSQALDESLSRGIARHDEQASLIWFPKFLKHNPPESPNVVKSWVGSYDDLPECPLKRTLLADMAEAVKGMAGSFRKAFAEAFARVLPEPMPNQEQEQEQEREDSRCSSSFPESGLSPDSGSAPLLSGEGMVVSGRETLVALPLNNGTEYPVSEADVAEWSSLYPAVDVAQQLRNMRGWLLASPARRKTGRGIRRFVTGWLAREQDRSGRASPVRQPGRTGMSRQAAVGTSGQKRQYHGDETISWAAQNEC